MSKTFENLRVFERAVEMMVDVYTATEELPKDERFGLTSQLRRASVSVVSHIAEGQGRLTYGEWRQMLSQARGSLYEVEAQVIAANRLNYLPRAVAEHLRKRARATGRELAGLIRWVRRRELELRSKPQPPRNPRSEARKGREVDD